MLKDTFLIELFGLALHDKGGLFPMRGGSVSKELTLSILQSSLGDNHGALRKWRETFSWGDGTAKLSKQ